MHGEHRGNHNLVCALALLLANMCSVYAQPAAASVTVCEALSNPQKFTNKIVRIEGVLSSGMHGVFFSAGNCKNASPRLQLGMCIKFAGQLDTPLVPFVADAIPLVAVASAVRTLLEKQTGFQSTAVVEGQLFIVESGGFCANNSYQALLVARNLVSFATSQVSRDH